MTYICEFELGDTVIIDHCETVKAIVIAVTFRFTGCSVQISYFDDHGLQEPWIDSWRLNRHDPR